MGKKDTEVCEAQDEKVLTCPSGDDLDFSGTEAEFDVGDEFAVDRAHGPENELALQPLEE